MSVSVKNILVTGLPGVGKTTLILKIAESMKHLRPVGFYTAEIREGGVRKGFELASFEGKRGVLAHIDIRSGHRVGKYKVDVKGFEELLDSLNLLDPLTRCIVIDEIGKMECLSSKFRSVVHHVLDSDKLLIATIALKGDEFIEKIKRRQDAMLFEIRKENREKVLQMILSAILPTGR